MRWLILGSLLAACAQDEAVLAYAINEPVDPVAVLELETFELDADGRRGSSGTVSGTEAAPLEFPVIGSFGYFDDEARSGRSIRICAIGRGEEVVLAAVSEPIRLRLDETVEVSLTLEPIEGDEVPPPCGSE